MAAQDWSTTATFTAGYSAYDVFLNFRGEDTRYNFTGFLNLVMKIRGIDVFMDSKRLWVGDAIGPALLRSIEGSKISIPVFSKGYADSKWCLQELAQIFQCYRSNGQLVLPIFFHVDPSHVRHQTGSFEKAFREHETNFKPHVVQSWRDALQEIGSLKGEVIDEKSDQAEIVELVARRVQDELVSSTHLAECKYPIGIDSRVEDLSSLLSISSKGVRFIGICGYSGIGKTTLAKAIYNQILSTFSRHSFISDVSKQANQYMGLVSLQKRLLKDLLRTEFDIGHHHKGKKFIAEKLRKENVLVVLDDVDSNEQLDALASKLDWFGEGSRVIITTKDEHILNVAKIDKDQIYYPQELDHKESLELFSLHAFSMHEPPPDYARLSHDVVRYSRGLPSTLEVLGSYLSDISSKVEWKSTLRKLTAGKASITRLASLRRKRKSTCSVKGNPLAWRQQLHGTIGISNAVALRKLKAAKASISRLTSFRRQRKSICGIKANLRGWRQQLHGTTGISNVVARISEVLGEFLDLNASLICNRVGMHKVQAATQRIFLLLDKAMSRFSEVDLDLYGSTFTDDFTAIDGKNVFTMAKIRVATNNFDESLVIGVGGFGKVYKGVLKDGTIVAFKRRNPQSSQGLTEFESETAFLRNVRHINLIRFIGFCHEKEEMVLVYEYIANGTLKNHLYGSDLPPLTWKQRLEICIGVARGLHYLHTGSERGIIHRDVKTSNILLDEAFVAKLIDFGIATTGPALNETHVSTVIKGTVGYLDPEYFRRQQLTAKSDVYSFGIVLFEVACARPAMSPSLPSDEIRLGEWARCQWGKRGSLESIVDPMLEGNYNPKSLNKFGEIAERCTAEHGVDRPTTREVLQGLEYALHLHEAWLRNSNTEEDYATFCSMSDSIGVRDSRVGIESPLARYDDCSGVEGYTYCPMSDLSGASNSRVKIESPLDRYDDCSREEENYACSSLVGTVWSEDSRSQIESASVWSDDSTAEEYFTCSSSWVGRVGCDEFSDLVNNQ